MLMSGCAPAKRRAVSADAGSALKVAMVTDAGGIDDRSFNAAAWDGLRRAERELGVTARYLESKEQSDYKTNLSSLADQGNRLVFAIGYLMEDALAEVAPRYPNTRFVIIDGSAPIADNCMSVKFREEEGAFLAGFLSGKMTKTGALGFVGGMEGPLIKKFECGFRAGARTARPDVRVIAKYIGSWTDVAKGKEYARAAIQQGADIVFHAAGKGGLGVLDAASEAGPGHYGIGVDKDQDGEHPGRVLTSLMKGVEQAVYAAVEDEKSGQWKAGERILGVKEGGIRLSPMKYTRKDVPDDVMVRLDAITKLVADGDVKVPRTEEEIQSFVPPGL
jgi:basic membrane protein A